MIYGLPKPRQNTWENSSKYPFLSFSACIDIITLTFGKYMPLRKLINLLHFILQATVGKQYV